MKKSALTKMIEEHGAVVYGIGKLGKNLYEMLRDYGGINPLLAWDKNALNIYDTVGLDILSEPIWEYDDQQIPIIVSVSAKQVYDAIYKELSSHGFENIYWIRETDACQFCACVDAKSVKKCNMCVINRGGVSSMLIA